MYYTAFATFHNITHYYFDKKMVYVVAAIKISLQEEINACSFLFRVMNIIFVVP